MGSISSVLSAAQTPQEKGLADPSPPHPQDEEVGQGKGKHSQAAFSFYKAKQKPWICQIHHIFKNLCFSLQKKSVQNKEKYLELPLD